MRIELREPAFELRLGGREEPFLAGYDVFADNKEDAARHAVAEFRHDSAMSSVGWGRVIERVIVGETPVATRVWDPQGEAEAERAAAEAKVQTTLPQPAVVATTEPAHTAPVPAITEAQPAAELEPPVQPIAAQGQTMAPAVAWSGWHTLAVVAGIGLGFYLGVRAARMRDAA